MKIIPVTLIMLITMEMNANPTRIKAGELIPSFQTTDVYGNPISDKTLSGKKTLITFLRNVGCPVCNLHVHQLLQSKVKFDSANIQIVLVYESAKENMLAYLKQEQYPFIFIPDAEGTLYTKFQIERSFGKFMKSNFHGVMGKMMKGKKLFKAKLKQDGHLATIGADFLIDENGKVIVAHYGNYVGDHLSTAEIIISAKAYAKIAEEGKQALDFTGTTIEGKSFKLSELKGSKILLIFFRNGACALCNLRVHELSARYDQLKKAGIKVVAVFESSIDDMKPYVGKQNVPFTLLSDPSGILYRLYGMKNSTETINRVLSSGSANARVEEAAKAGFALTQQPNSNFFRIPGEVLIDKNFTVSKIHYCNELINHFSVENILELTEETIEQEN